jgi:membrane protease YdiL (CAAX protease family)
MLHRNSLHNILLVIGEYILISVVGAVIIPLACMALVPRLPELTNLTFANNVTRTLHGVFVIAYVLLVYRRRSWGSVWLWGTNDSRKTLPMGIIVPVGFLIRLLFDGGLNKLNMLFLPMQSDMFTSVVTVPLAEELLFRGFLLRRLSEYLPKRWPAILLSTVIFGLRHDNFLQAFVSGLLLCLLYAPQNDKSALSLGTGKLWVSIVTHALVNIKTQ